MGQKAYKERLKEIEMSEYDDKVYKEYSLPVQNQVLLICCMANQVVQDYLTCKISIKYCIKYCIHR